jgi:GNAT superfamily N-acetyltransferase
MSSPAKLASEPGDHDASSVPSPIRIEPVTNRRQLEAFIRLPNRLYRDCPNYVAPLLIERRDTLRVDKNAYFQHAEGQYWLAWRGDRLVGRISAQIDQLYLAKYQDATGHFGMLDAEDDPAAFQALLTTAEDWLRARGMQRVLGPFNLSINEECGLLVDGFDAPAMLMMGFARPYAAQRVGELGYCKVKDLLAYDYDVTSTPPIRGDALLDRTGDAHRVRVRHVDMARYHAELSVIMDIFNDAWASNWGSVPFTEAEITHIANGMRPLIRPELIWIAEVDGSPACMIVCLPNLYETIADLNGRLLPFGWLKLLWRLKMTRPRTGRVLLMGIRPSHRRTLLGSALILMVLESLRQGVAKEGLERIELSWVLEDNLPMRRVIESIGGRVCKTYRIFEKSLV